MKQMSIIGVCLCMIGWTLGAQAQLGASVGGAPQAVRIESRGAADMRIPIAVPPCTTLDSQLLKTGTELAQVIADDLVFTGLFKVLAPNQFPPGFQGLPADPNKINLDTWKGSAENLVYGVLAEEGGVLVCQFRLFDVTGKEQLVGQELRVEKAHPRLAAHRFSEEIIRVLEGTPGVGTSEIFFSAGGTGKKEIYVSDYDGANIRQMTKHGSISIRPKVSPDGNKVAYLSYKDRYSFLYVFDRRTGASIPLSKEVGLNSSPAWSPRGDRLALTLSKDGNTEIYLKNPDGKNAVRLTRNKDGDTSPCFSPDGSRIAFVSDRGGNPQVYCMGADGGNQVRLSHQGGNSYDPAWSPDGQLIAYVVERRGESFQIYMMGADGSNPVQLTTSGTNESPSWSPDSRHVIFARSGVLWTVNTQTLEQRQVPRLNLRCEGPSWGPRRQ